ncbi:DUF4446 family protein [Patescibacteria group bacterium]|nr:MAG: DUF4446 family protein [Patescibacteria group bacterium]
MQAFYQFIQNNVVWVALGSGALSLVALFIAISALLRARAAQIKSRAFFEGKNGKDLEEVMVNNAEELSNLDKDIQELYAISNKINALALRSIHRVGVIRFNPFKDIGGDQSFSVALLDGKGSGATISSLHTREGTRVYVKPILLGKSEKYPLTDEEQQAIKIASITKGEKTTE